MRQVFTLRSTALILVIAITSFAVSVESHGAGTGKAVSQVPRTVWDRLYFGTTKSESGTLGWLLYLDIKEHRGKLYVPPVTLNLIDIKVDEDRITFRSEQDISELHYEFAGRISSQIITGELTSRNRRLNTSTAYQMVFTKLDPRTTSVTGIAGHYSNVTYSSMGGDLFGKEMVLISVNQKVAGILVLYDEGDDSPYAVEDFTSVGKRIRFRVRTVVGQEVFEGSLSAAGITLRRIDEPTATNSRHRTLLRKKDLLKVFK